MKAASKLAPPAPTLARPRPAARPSAERTAAQASNHRAAGPFPPTRATTVDPGQPLPATLRASLAPIVGPHAVDAARVHTDPTAAAIALLHDARAVTDRDHIYFAHGHYRPGTPAGDFLIAHEVAHVDQAQRGLLDRPALKAMSGPQHDALEAAADRTGDRLAPGADLEQHKRPRPRHDTTPAANLAPGPPGPRAPAGPDVAPAPLAAATTSEPAVSGPAPQAALITGPDLPLDLPLMPTPTLGLSSAEEQRVGAVKSRAGDRAAATRAAPPAKASVSAAQAAVQTPQAENDARAAQKVVVDLSQLPPPSPEIVALCERIKTLILGKRPASEQAVIDTRPQEVAKAAGDTLEKDVKKNVDDARSTYSSIDQKPAGPASAMPASIEPLPPAAATPAVNAAAAVPDAVPPEKVSLDGDVEAMNQRAAPANTATARLATSGPLDEIHTSQAEMQAKAKDGPAAVLEQQAAALTAADTGMRDLQARAAAALTTTRKRHAVGVKSGQGDLKGGEEALRAKLSTEAKTAFQDAQTKVQDLLKPVHEAGMKKWSANLPLISRRFNDDLKIVKDKIDRRHEGVGGFFVGMWDAVAGLPKWVQDAYDAAEKRFGDDVCNLITEISQDVNFVVEQAKKIVEKTRKDIHAIFTDDLPDGLKAWAEQQETGFAKQLDELDASAEKTRSDFNKELIESAGTAVQTAREKIQKLREEAGGIWGRFLAALDKFLDDPVKFIIEGLLELVGISPPAFWAVIAKVQQVAKDIADAPLKFANNLLDGVAKGFGLFFENIDKHLLGGFIEWLLSGMKDVGISIEIPKEFSLKSVLTFFLSLLGISWARIRKLLVEQLGEKPVMIMEKTAGVIYSLATKGIDAIFEDIKKMLEPKTIVDAIMDAAIKYLIETLIVQVATRIVTLLNPAGAVLQALEAIYRVLKWVFTNAAKLFHFVEAVVNGMADVVAGNVGGVAKTVEKALAMLIGPVIDFLADYLGLGGLPGKIANAVKGLQTYIESVLHKIIKWLVEQGRKLLGIKGDDKKQDTGEIGQRLAFKTGNETHHLYITVAGKNATVMVASTPMTATSWLDDIQTNKVPTLTDPAQQKHATTLIATARTQLAATDTDADKAAVAQSDPAAPAVATNVNKDEEALGATLSELGKLFGQPILVRALKIPEIENFTDYTDALVLSIESTQTGLVLRADPTGPEFVAKLLAQRKGEAIFDEKTGTLSLPGLTAAKLASAASTALFGDHAVLGTGVARVEFKKGEADFALIGTIDDVKATLAKGTAPAFKPLEKTAPMHGGQDLIRIVNTGGKANLINATGWSIMDLLTRAKNNRYSQVRNKVGQALIDQAIDALAPSSPKLASTKVSGWLSPDARALFDGALTLTAETSTRIGSEFGLANIQRTTVIEDSANEVVNMDMEIPGSIAGNPTHKKNFETEFERQLKLQQNGLNKMSLDTWFANIDTYKATVATWLAPLEPVALNAIFDELMSRINKTAALAKRESKEIADARTRINAISKELQSGTLSIQQALDQITVGKQNKYIRTNFTGRFGNEDVFREMHQKALIAVFDQLKAGLEGLEDETNDIKNAVLHNPDQIAGGFGMLPNFNVVAEPVGGEDNTAWVAYLKKLRPYIGASRINSRIGPLWRGRIGALYTKIKGTYTKEAAYPLWRLNLTLVAIYT